MREILIGGLAVLSLFAVLASIDWPPSKTRTGACIMYTRSGDAMICTMYQRYPNPNYKQELAAWCVRHADNRRCK